MSRMRVIPLLALAWSALGAAPGAQAEAPATSAARPARIIYYQTGCDNAEVRSDIEHSISGITGFATRNGIRLVRAKRPGKCGYVLAQGGRKKRIPSALTDVDLAEAARAFFRLRPSPAPAAAI